MLLEIARLIQENGIDIGVDFVLFDAEDNGDSGTGRNWCLGSKYWSKNPHKKGYTAEFGILLDLVGAKNAEFGKEAFSMQSASKYVNKIWDLATKMSYGNYFLDMNLVEPIRDSTFMNSIASIFTGSNLMEIDGKEILGTGFPVPKSSRE